MPHFPVSTEVPSLPAYLFEADLAISIIPPQAFTVVPTNDTRVFLNWYKEAATTDDNFLYSEVYRSTNLQDWYLIASLDYPTAYYYDHDVEVGKNYYYKVRFVRIDVEGFIITSSQPTFPLAATPVSKLGFEPRDTYSNKFFRYLIEAMRGIYIYDHTDAGYFLSNKEYLWQTTCRILDGFTVKADGTVVHTEPSDPAALYNKRNVSFFLTNKHTKLLGVEQSTGEEGELIQVSKYLIYTFLMGYAIQFLTLYERYKDIVASKYVDASQIYSKGFRPIVSSQKDITIAELFDTFGSMLGLEPLKAFSGPQGDIRYKAMLQSSFSNINNVGKFSAIDEACQNVLGITTQSVFEYWKYPWFRASRDFKLFAFPSGADTVFGYAVQSGAPFGANVNVKFTSLQEPFNIFVEYLSGNLVVGNEFLNVYGSSPEDPYTYIISAYISNGYTPASTIPALISANMSCNWLLSAASSNGSLSGTIFAQDRFRLTRHTPWLAWEAAMLKMYGRTFLLKDASASLTNVIDSSRYIRMIAKSDPNSTIGLGGAMVGSKVFQWNGSAWVLTAYNPFDPAISPIADAVVVRDDNDEGPEYEYTVGPNSYKVRHTGTKNLLFKIAMTPAGMSWIQDAQFQIPVVVNTKAGYLRLYRIKRSYNEASVSWNFRDKVTLPGNNWNGSSYDLNTKDWITKYWDAEGGVGEEDRVLLKEIYVPEIAYPGTTVYVDISDVVKQIYKYESSNLNLGGDPNGVLECGFMLTAEGLPNKSIMSFISNFETYPIILYRKMGCGFIPAPAGTKYFYTDGTTRYGRLLVRQSDREPINYIRTVNERIRVADIRMTTDITLEIGTIPADFTVDAVIYGTTSKASGIIKGIGATSLTVSEEIGHFLTESITRAKDDTLDAPSTATISSISRTGFKKVRLARSPIKGSLLRVYYTGAATAAVSAREYPAYTPYVEGMDGLWPVFESTIANSATRLYFAVFDSEDSDVVNLNTTLDLTALGDIIVTYQYEYDFLPMGRVIADDAYIQTIEGCQRPDSHLFAQADKDMKYRAEVLLPKSSGEDGSNFSGHLVDISGDPRAHEYSDYNLGVLSAAIKNIRRFDGAIDIFKYGPYIKDYRYNQTYHTFFRSV